MERIKGFFEGENRGKHFSEHEKQELVNWVLYVVKLAVNDAGYRKTFEAAVANFDLKVDIAERIKPNGWLILPKRWRVERTFAWMNNSRRLSHISTSLKHF